MGRAKNDRWKKILGIILNIALLLLIDGLLVYTFINEGNRIYKGTIIKILLIVTGNILFLVLLFWGEKICSAIKNTTFLRIADVILLLATPGIVFMLVQMVTWVSGYKNKAVSTFKGLVKMSLLMEQPYLRLNLIIYAIFFIILIILFRKIIIASSVLCYLFIILAMVNYYVMEFRGPWTAVGRDLRKLTMRKFAAGNLHWRSRRILSGACRWYSISEKTIVNQNTAQSC